jgi:hypothetical protein
LAFGPWPVKLDPVQFAPAVINVFGLMACMAGLASLVSAAGNHRSSTVGIMCGFYVLSLLAKLVGRMSPRFGFVGWLSIFNVFEPQRLVSGTPESWELLACYDGVLIGLGLAAFITGGIIFSRRDLPAPL